MKRWFDLLRWMRGKWVRVSSEYRAMLFRLRGVRLGRRPCLEARIELLHRAECIELADGVSVETGVKLTVSNLCTEARALVVGTNSFIGRFSQITARQSVSIGANVMIAPFCYITETNHGMDPGRPMQEQASTWAGIRIEDDVWLGNGCTVLPGVTIGKGAVIGANSVVTHDIPPMAIAVGSPARVIKYRA